jgi:hypothetical protein
MCIFSRFSIAGLGFLALSAPMTAAETVNLQASTTTVALSGTVTIDLTLAGGEAFNSAQGYLEWDPSLLQLASAPSTTMLDSNAEPFSGTPFTSATLNTARTAGHAKRTFFTTAGNITPAATQVLMRWTFTAVGNGTAVIRTRQGSPSEDYTKLGSISGTSGVTRYPAVGGEISITTGSGGGNRAPTVANPIPDQAAVAGSPFAFSFAGNTFADGVDTDLRGHSGHARIGAGDGDG